MADKYPSTTLVTKDPKETDINKAVLDLLKKINEVSKATTDTANALIPIGFTYVQFPGQADPTTIWSNFTWKNISSTMAGDFPRFEGGLASAFNSGEQAHMFQSHLHGWALSAGNTLTGVGTSGAGASAGNMTTVPQTDAGVGAVQTGVETRPVNKTVRLWVRTA